LEIIERGSTPLLVGKTNTVTTFAVARFKFCGWVAPRAYIQGRGHATKIKMLEC
jgi:hypothetical protein